MNETSKHKAPVRAAGLYPADILLPDFSAVSGTRWSVVACDQYTSQPDYWQRAEELVGDAPSTLRLILPEVWLDEAPDRIPGIHAAMEDCLRRVLRNRPDSMVLVERRLHGGQLRRGLVGCIDLEEYDYSRGAQSLIRATEATVPERIPPRMTIREGAWLELPHVMLLTDDRACTVVEPLADETDAMELAYDYDLMLDGGHLRGYFLTDS